MKNTLIVIGVAILLAINAEAQQATFSAKQAKEAYHSGELTMPQYVEKLELIAEGNTVISLSDQFVATQHTDEFTASGLIPKGFLLTAFNWLIDKLKDSVIDYFNLPCEKDNERWAEIGKTLMGRLLKAKDDNF